MRVNIGVAVNLDERLIVPVIGNADRKDLGQLARDSRDVAERARAGRLQLQDISDGTFTITNLGTTGVDLFTPIINPPGGYSRCWHDTASTRRRGRCPGDSPLGVSLSCL